MYDQDREEDEAADDDVLDEETIREVLRREVKEAKLIQASRIGPMPVEWLWEGRIPLGQLTLLAGDPGVGKSLIALDLAARVSTGAAWPDEPAPAQPGLAEPASRSQPRDQANVLILSVHENLMTTLCPRLERAGADLQRIFFGAGVPLSSPRRWLDHRPIRVPDDFMSLARVFMELAPVKLLVLDPAWAFCHRGRGRSRVAGPAQLEELSLLAARFKLAIVGVTDLARVNRTHVAYRAAGSRALTAAARVAWGVLRHPRERDRRLLLPLQMTIAKPAAGIEF